MKKKSLLKDMVHGMEQKSVISEQQVISVYKTKEQFLRERQKHVKELMLQEMFQNVS
jgi:hypothetical protein